MKKLLLTMLGVVGMLCSTSCSDEEIVASVEGDAMVQFAVELDGAGASRADDYKISDGTTVDKVYYEVYTNVNGTQTPMNALKGEAKIEGKQARVNLALVKGQAYDIVFWASKEGVYNTTDLRKVTVKDQNSINVGKANDETRDAFTAVYRTAKVTGPIKETIKLYRPFAQINFGTLLTDMQAAEKAGAKLTVSKIQVSNLADYYNALSEEGCVNDGEELKTLEFGENPIHDRASQELTFGEGVTPTYEYLATAYVLFAGKATDQVTTDLTMTVPTGLNQDVVLTVPNAPAQRNFRTNILGNLLTNTADFNIVVDPIYKGDYNPISAWDGKTVTEPAVVDGAYVITSAAEFAWLAGKSIDKNIELKTNVDMSGNKFVSMAVKLNAKVVFNGNNNAISNIVVVNGNNESGFGEAAGLFASTPNHGSSATALTVKDLTVSEMTINNPGQWVGAIIGYAQSNNDVIENVTVKNSVIKGGTPDNGGSFGGLVGYVQNNCTLTISNSKVVDTYVEAAEKAAGSLIGTSSGKVTISNTSVENVEVVAPTMQGGYIGRLVTGSVELTGCEGDVLYGAWLGGTLTVNDAPVTKEVSDFASLKAAVDAATAGDMILLGDGTFEGYLNIGKNVTLKAYKGNAIFDGMIHVTNSNTEIKLEGLTLKNTNGVKTSATDLTAKVNGSIVGIYNAKKVEIVDCTFDITGDYGVMGYAVYGDVIIDGCVFNCNKKRPIATNGQYTKVTGCTFNNQYQYSLRLYEWAGEKQTVVFTDNTIAGETQKTPIDGINFSNRGNLGDYSIYGDFTITGNTTGLSFRYKNGMSMNAASTYNTDVEGFEFVSE